MSQYYTLLTPIGLAKVANAQVTQSTVAITQIAVGDGNGSSYAPSGKETTLKNEKWRGVVTSVSVDNSNPNWVVVDAILPGNIGGFTLREVGLFDSDGDLIAIGNYPDTYKPVVGDGSIMDLTIRTIIEVNNASSVTLKIDPNVIIASRPYVDGKVEEVKKELNFHANNNEIHLQPGDRDKINEAWQKGVYNEDDITNLKENNAKHIALKASKTVYGHVLIGNGINVNDGVISVPVISDATTTQKGITQLNDTLTSTSTSQAATANAVKQVNDKLIGESTKIGKDSSANSKGGISIGANTKASGVYSIAISDYAEATSGWGIAIGQAASTTGDRGVALGIGAGAKGVNSIAIGANPSANGTGSIAIGNNVQAPNNYDAILGTANNVWKIGGSLSVSGGKNFEIPHPHPDKKHTHVIRHGAVESPTTGDTLYRFSVEINKEIAHVSMFGAENILELPTVREDDVYRLSIPLPDYWIWLNTNEQVSVNPERHFGVGYGYVNRENETLELIINTLKNYNAILFGTRNDDNVQDWYIKGVEREIGESWLGETYAFEVDEITEVTEFEEVL
ncbi:phage tail protein [Lysinibacillus sp. Bpr_S20]|uniref:phage tail-collar fiber domain-containing protein n=1 Tax=Lysinibacillus sp. Bpr_S20 TaxID=2933964 RepID=UPI0020112C14|nr:phage tail protein [Lysinibacillus sp. Bpr_S20]MCL1701635.1 phage tail protein [Lysinibacillus sp. Bpr_S20]